MDYSEKVKNQLQELGITFPLKGNKKELLVILQAYIVDRKINLEILKNYFTNVGPSTKTLIESLKQFSVEQTKISTKTLDLINNAVEICKIQLQKDLSKEERESLNNQVFEYIKEARKESNEHRKFLLQLAAIGGATLLIIGGITVLILTRGKNPQLVQKGAEIIGKVVKNL